MLVEKNKIPISLLSTYNDLIKNQLDNSKSPTQFYIKIADIRDYYLDKITLIFNAHFISRKDLFIITQSLIGNIVYLNKEIRIPLNYENSEDKNIGKISNFKSSKFKSPQGMTGIITSSTDFNLRSSSSSVNFLIEISQETFNFSICTQVKYELIIELIKNILIKLKKSHADHIINIIFFTRVIFDKKEFLKLNISKKDNFFFENIYNSSLNKDENFFDLYSHITKISLKKFDLIEIEKNLIKAFLKFKRIFNVKDFCEYITNITEEYNTKTNLNEKEKQTKFSNNENINNFNFSEENFFHFNDIYSLKFLSQIKNFKLCKSTQSNILEAINILLNDIKYDREKMLKLGNMITVISSGDYFPYYSKSLAKITKENIYQQGVACSLIILSEKIKSDMYKNKLNPITDLNIHNYNSNFKYDENNLDLLNFNNNIYKISVGSNGKKFILIYFI